MSTSEINSLLVLMKENIAVYRTYEKQIDYYLDNIKTSIVLLGDFINSNNLFGPDLVLAYKVMESYHTCKNNYLQWSIYRAEVKRYIARYCSTVAEFKSNVIKNVPELCLHNRL